MPADDVAWLRAGRGVAVRTWSGTLGVLPAVTLIQCGGHFPGSAVLHWASGADGRGVLLSGDTIFVTPGEDRVTFVWSAPNRLPLSEAAVRGVWEAVRPFAFDRIYGGWWTPVLRSGAWESCGGRRCGTWSTCGARLSLLRPAPGAAPSSGRPGVRVGQKPQAQGPGAGGGVPAQFVDPGGMPWPGDASTRQNSSSGWPGSGPAGLATIPG